LMVFQLLIMRLKSRITDPEKSEIKSRLLTEAQRVIINIPAKVTLATLAVV